MEKSFFDKIFVIAAIVIAIIAVHSIVNADTPQPQVSTPPRYQATTMTAHRMADERVALPTTNHIETVLPQETEEVPEPDFDMFIEEEWAGPVLNPVIGTIYGPTGKETYYNLPMGGVISIMRDLGYSEDEYPYWERDDGCKMFGDYIMVAANLDHFPKGTIVECSLGTAMVCDTGEFAYYNEGWNWLDIAVNW